MKKNPLNKDIIMENADGIETATPAMVEARAREAARMYEEGISEADHDQMLRAAEAEQNSDERES
jgi:hypothetical protein